MQLEEADASALKVWVMKKLDDISDADSDVLADYVLALVRSDAPDDALRMDTKTQLQDFLGDHTSSFVDELFEIIGSRAYTSRRPTIAPTLPNDILNARNPLPTAPQTRIPNQVRALQGPHGAPTGPRSSMAQNFNRKRPFSDLADSRNELRLPTLAFNEGHGGKRGRRDGADAHWPSGVAGYGSSGGGSSGSSRYNHQGQHDRLPGVSHLMKGVQANGGTFPPFDMQNAAAAMLTFQAMGMQLPPFERIGSPTHGLQGRTNGIPCDDYNRKGFCRRGVSCPFDHGNDQVLIPQPSSTGQYDLHGASNLAALSASSAGQYGDGLQVQQQNHHRRGGRGKTSVFSKRGPNYDKRLSTIVVEEIPEENFDEHQVRRFFQAFGPIAEIDMQPYKRLAIIRFKAHEDAKAAYDSPKVIFDNRFVRVFWLNSDSLEYEPVNQNRYDHYDDVDTPFYGQEPYFSKEELDEKTALAQKKFEERQRLIDENVALSHNMDQERLELEKRIDEERDRLASKLAEKGIDPDPILIQTNKSMRAQRAASSLKAQLSVLLEQARKLGIDPYEMEDGVIAQHQHQSGSYQAGHHVHPKYYSGDSRGTKMANTTAFGSSDNAVPFRGAVIAGGKYNLDLRPRRVRIVAQDGEWTDEKDEALREHLISLGEYEAIETVPLDEDGHVIIAFKDRPTAEAFFWGPRHFANIGNLTFSWVANPQITISDSSRVNGDVDMANADTESYIDMTAIDRDDRNFEDDSDVEFDVAEEDERWMVK